MQILNQIFLWTGILVWAFIITASILIWINGYTIRNQQGDFQGWKFNQKKEPPIRTPCKSTEHKFRPFKGPMLGKICDICGKIENEGKSENEFNKPKSPNI